MRILHRYILKEHILPFFFGIILFTFLFFLSEIIKSSELIISKQASPILIFNLFLCYIPSTFNITIPIALLTAVLITWGKFKAENEITAMWASGINLNSSIIWMTLIGIIFSFITLVIGETILPWTNRAIEKIQTTILHEDLALHLEEREFIKIGQRELFIDKLDRKKRQLMGVYIYEYNSSFGAPQKAIFAKSAEYIKSHLGIILKLKEGSIHQVNEKNPSKYHILTFNSHLINLSKWENINKLPTSKSIKTMTISELKKEIKKYKDLNLNVNPLLIELSKHLALPFSCLTFVFLGLPLGLIVCQKEKSIGFGISVLIIFAYYLLFKLNEALAVKGLLNPILALWLPNIILSSLGIILLLELFRKPP